MLEKDLCYLSLVKLLSKINFALHFMGNTCDLMTKPSLKACEIGRYLLILFLWSAVYLSVVCGMTVQL